MNVNELEIKVKANLVIDKRTAEMCLKMLECYCNDTNAQILCNRDITGQVNFRFEEPTF